MLRKITLIAMSLVALAGANQLAVSRVEVAPVLDGVLDDACWAEAELWEGFIQRDPAPGEPATEQTDIRIVYTADTIYIAFDCHDSAPEEIIGRLYRRDSALVWEDNIDLWLDPTGDGRFLYYFGTNPAGVKYDALNGIRGFYTNPQWDAHWDVGTAINAGGWVAEIAIPFANFQFDDSNGKNWLIQTGRVIRRKSEECYMTEVPYEYSMFYTEYACELTGIEGIDSGLGMEIVPYVKGDYRKYPQLSGDNAEVFKPFGGLDVDFNIGNNFTIAGTLFPDFAEIDMDPNVYQNSRSQYFIGETRPFFLEGANFFRSAGHNHFYSRRIGKRLFDSDGIYHDATIVGGGRVTGTVGPVGVGAFYAHTEEVVIDANDEINARYEPESDWAVTRLTTELWQNSYVGVVATSRFARSTTYSDWVYDSVNDSWSIEEVTAPAYDFASYALDYDLSFFENQLNTWGQLSGVYDSRNEVNDFEDQFGTELGASFRVGNFWNYFMYQDSAKDFNLDETGFVGLGGMRRFRYEAGYRIPFGNGGWIRNINLNASTDHWLQRDGEKGFNDYTLFATAMTNDSWFVNLGIFYSNDYLVEVENALGGYFGLMSDQSQAVSFGIEGSYGPKFFDYNTSSKGTTASGGLELTVRPIPALEMNGGINYNHWKMEEGQTIDGYTVILWESHITYLLSNDFYIRLLGLGGDFSEEFHTAYPGAISDTITMRALVGWEFMPDSNIYLAYEQWRDNTDNEFQLINQGIFLKADYYLQF